MQFLHFVQDFQRVSVGGKAARLIELDRLHIAVPYGFVLEIAEVARMVRSGALGEAVFKDVDEYLDSTHGFAVRSSAADEDGAYSWAGQFLTRLSVPAEELTEAVLACARSADSPAVRAYAAVHHRPSPRLAIIIQEMVPAEYAGVLFTTDPTSLSSEMVVEAVVGLGELLVSGQRSPSRVFLDRETGVIVRRSGEMEPMLPTSILSQLFEIGRTVTAHFGCPQDVEWAVDHDGKLFVTQCRDVTARLRADLALLRQQAIAEAQSQYEDEQRRLSNFLVALPFDVFSDHNIVELIGRHPPRMIFDVFNALFGHGPHSAIQTGRAQMGYEIGHELDAGLFVLIAGQPRVSIAHDAMTYRLRGMALPEYLSAVRFYLQAIRSNPRLASYPEIHLYEQMPDDEWLERIYDSWLARLFVHTHDLFRRDVLDSADRLEAQTMGWIVRWRDRLESTGSDHGAVAARSLIDLLRTEACQQFVRVARVGFFAYACLHRLLSQRAPGEAEHLLHALTCGTPVERNPHLRLAAALWQMRQGLRSLSTVVAEFGHLGPREFDLSAPRYHECPEMLTNLAARLTVDPAVTYAQSATEADAAFSQMVHLFEDEEAEQVRQLVLVTRRFLPLRELVKFELLRGIDRLRAVLLDLNERCGFEPGLVFHLSLADPIEAFDSDPARLRSIALVRQEQWDGYRQLYLPPVLFSDKLSEIGLPPLVSSNKVLTGVGVTSYVVEGPVVVVRSLGDAEALNQLVSGCVIVTATTDPAWAQALTIVGPCGGLVTEVGGLLAHGAIYAREMRIAAVLNVERATERLKTGMRVRVNGPASRIEIL